MADADFRKPRVDTETVAALNGRTAEDLPSRLRAVPDCVKGRVIFTTSFGIEDQLISHHIFSQRLPVAVATLDTGRLFPETHAVWQQTEEQYGVRIHAFYPDADSLEALVADQGINGFYHSREARLSCCQVRKVEPLGRALAGAAGWITGLRAGQSGHRSDTGFAEWLPDRRLIRIAPLFDYDRARVVAECVKLGVPVNELHSRCFASVGCAPCTRAIRPGEPERAGRWWWESGEKKECGLHVDGSGRLARSASS